MRAFVLLSGLVAVALNACSSPETTNRPDESPGTTVSTTVTVTQAGDRIVGIDLSGEGALGFERSIATVTDIGASDVELTVFWDELETAPGVFEPQVNNLKLANSYYPSIDMTVGLVVAVVDTTTKRVPADLEDIAFDDPRMIQRFDALVEWIATQVPDTDVSFFSVGNEVDIYLEANEAWVSYTSFVPHAKDSVKRHLGEQTPVGVKATLTGLIGNTRAETHEVNSSCDVILVTHYPLDDDFQVSEPRSIDDDLTHVLELYPRRDVIVAELGYPTGGNNGSSRSMQAAFIHAVFRFWDRYADRIPLIHFTWLDDIPQEDVEYYGSYYGLDSGGFLSFLGSLGMRDEAGNAKVGFNQLELELGVRGW